MNSRAAAVISSILLLTLSCFAQNAFDKAAGMNANSLTVTVRDANGNAAADARVEVRDNHLGQMVKAGYTNSAGMVEITGLATGSYDVVAVKGLSQVTEHTDVRSFSTTVNISLNANSDPDVGSKTSVSVAQFKVPGKARKEYDKAKKALADRKVEEAEARIKKALEIYPKYSDALTLSAILKMDRQQLDAASADLDLALQYDPANATAYLVYGANLNMQSKFDQAIQTLERGIAMDPSSWQGYFEMGKANVGKANYKQAMKYLEKAQALVDFEYPPIHLVKGHALLSMKEYEPAMAELQLFLDKSPQDPRSEGTRKTLEQVRAYVQR